MELVTKQGFKKTEVGLIPEDWKVIRLSEALFKEQLPSGLYKDKSLYGSGTKIIKLGDVFAYDYYMPQFAQRVEISGEELNSYTIKVGDLIVALASVKIEGVGKVLLVDKLDEPTVFDHNVALIRLDKNYDSKYFGHIFKSNKIRNQVSSNATQVSTTFLKASSLKKFNIPIPPTLKEQKAIATALSDVDALIASLESLIAKKQAIKQGAMQQLLTPPHKGGKRLPGFSGEWVEMKLGEIAQINMGQSPLSINYNMEGIGLPLVQGNADIKFRKTIIRNYTSQITKKADEGDIIMSVRAPVGEVAKSSFSCCIGRGVCSIKFPNEYLYHHLIWFESSWGKFSTGSTFDSINSNQLKRLELVVPINEEEQKAIAKILSDMDVEIEELETKKAKYQQLKQGMMQELLTGKTRLL